MANYKKARKFVDKLEYNGNYKLALHDVKGDKGGLTYKGIAKNYHPNWKGWGLIEKLGKDPKKLEESEDLQDLVNAFYRPQFWDVIKGDDITYQATAEEIYQFAVVAGAVTAVKKAQEVVGVKIDGIMGKQTLALINSMAPDNFCRKFTELEHKRIDAIVKNNPSQKKFEDGWDNRADSINGDNANKIV